MAYPQCLHAVSTRRLDLAVSCFFGCVTLFQISFFDLERCLGMLPTHADYPDPLCSIRILFLFPTISWTSLSNWKSMGLALPVSLVGWARGSGDSKPSAHESSSEMQRFAWLLASLGCQLCVLFPMLWVNGLPWPQKWVWLFHGITCGRCPLIDVWYNVILVVYPGVFDDRVMANWAWWRLKLSVPSCCEQEHEKIKKKNI